ncbi:MAG: TonB family protein [Acidobacteriia bacterium]|nr:TonB family protein [Terriglobia bacterium]
MSSRLIWDNLVIYSLQIGLLVGLAGFMPTLLRLRSPRAKLAYWQILLAACLLLPVVRPWRQEVIAAVGVPVSTAVAVSLPAPPGPSTRPAIPRTEIALLLVAVGALVRLAWLGVGFWHLRRYRLNSTELGTQNGLAAFLSDEIGSPVTFGWRKPVVLLPARFPEMDRRIQDAILCHEALHVERRDWLFTVTEEVVRAIFWFHPAIWWLLGEIHLAREQAVDSQAIERTEAREEYLDALLAIAGANPQMDVAMAPLFLRKRHLRQRVASIVKEVRMSRTKLISRLAMGLGVLAAACWFVTGTLPLAAAPQVAHDAAGVTVDVGASALLHRAPVSYPEAARKHGVQGTVMVEATLDGSGNVTDARVLSGPDELRKAALQSVLQWHFQGAAAGATRTVSIAFQLPAAQEQPTPGATAPAIFQGKNFEVRLNPAGSVEERKQGNPAIQAKVAEARAQQPNVEQFVEQLRGGSPTATGTRTLKSLRVAGLSDQMRDELLSRLPVHEGDTLTDESQAKLVAAVKAYDEHLLVMTMSAPTGETRVIVTVPAAEAQWSAFVATKDSPVADSTNINTSGPKLIRQVRPVYPSDAKAARLAGTVKLSAIIAADGTVKKLEVISGHPVFVPAALDAVRQWVYQPTLLNGNPVDVSTEISVNFTLSQ